MAQQPLAYEYPEFLDSNDARPIRILAEYLEPATSAAIEPDNKGGAASEMAAEARELAGELTRPVQARETSMNLWRRMYLLVRRVIGR